MAINIGYNHVMTITGVGLHYITLHYIVDF